MAATKENVHRVPTFHNTNSFCRKKQFGRCVYNVAMPLFPEDFFILLGLEKIPDTEVMLKPGLLRHLARAEAQSGEDA